MSAVPVGIRPRVRLIPKSSPDAVEGVEHLPDRAAIKARVRAVDGKANAAVTLLIAGWIGAAKGKVSLIAGQKSRTKSLQIEGNPDNLGRRIDAHLAALDDTTGKGKAT